MLLGENKIILVSHTLLYILNTCKWLSRQSVQLCTGMSNNRCLQLYSVHFGKGFYNICLEDFNLTIAILSTYIHTHTHVSQLSFLYRYWLPGSPSLCIRRLSILGSTATLPYLEPPGSPGKLHQSCPLMCARLLSIKASMYLWLLRLPAAQQPMVSTSANQRRH